MIKAKNNFYVEFDGLATGPFSEEAIQEKINRKELNGQNRVYSRAYGNWIPLSDTPRFANDFPAALQNKVSATDLPFAPVYPPKIPTKLVNLQPIRIRKKVKLSEQIPERTIPLKKISVNKKVFLSKQAFPRKIEVRTKLRLSKKLQLFFQIPLPAPRIVKPTPVKPAYEIDLFASREEEIIYLDGISRQKSFAKIPLRPDVEVAPAFDLEKARKFEAAKVFAEQSASSNLLPTRPEQIAPQKEEAQRLVIPLQDDPKPTSLAKKILWLFFFTATASLLALSLYPLKKSGEKESEWTSRPPSPAMKKTITEEVPPPKPPVRPSRD